jgi:hypothetical protein
MRRFRRIVGIAVLVALISSMVTMGISLIFFDCALAPLAFCILAAAVGGFVYLATG